jgi:hypothetical protein
MQKPSSIQVGINFHFFQLSGIWVPNDHERKAAWELYVELVTRISVVKLGPEDGLLREALSSLYSIFGTTRDVLRRYGPAVAERRPSGQYNFGVLAVGMLNSGLRPVLAKWHPALEEWESLRPEGTSRRQHEQAWAHCTDLRADLDTTRDLLTQYAQLMADACNIPDLLGYPDMRAGQTT